MLQEQDKQYKRIQAATQAAYTRRAHQMMNTIQTGESNLYQGDMFNPQSYSSAFAAQTQGYVHNATKSDQEDYNSDASPNILIPRQLDNTPT